MEENNLPKLSKNEIDRLLGEIKTDEVDIVGKLSRITEGGSKYRSELGSMARIQYYASQRNNSIVLGVLRISVLYVLLLLVGLYTPWVRDNILILTSLLYITVYVVGLYIYSYIRVGVLKKPLPDGDRYMLVRRMLDGYTGDWLTELLEISKDRGEYYDIDTHVRMSKLNYYEVELLTGETVDYTDVDISKWLINQKLYYDYNIYDCLTETDNPINYFTHGVITAHTQVLGEDKDEVIDSILNWLQGQGYISKYYNLGEYPTRLYTPNYNKVILDEEEYTLYRIHDLIESGITNTLMEPNIVSSKEGNIITVQEELSNN